MQDKLKELEIEYSIDWREYRIEDLFKIDRGNISKQGELVDNADGVVFVAQNDNRNGFVKRVYPSDNKVFDGKTIAIGRQTGVVYYQPERFVTTDGVLVLSAFKMIVKSDRIGLYLTSLIQKQLLIYGYTNTVSAAKLKTLKLCLPTQNGEVAFNYIEEFISTFQAERLAMLNEYLLATGLKDVELNSAEHSALDKLGTDSVSYMSVKFNVLFNHIQQGKRLKKSDQLDGDIPFVMAGTTNTGIVKYISNPVRSFPKNSLTIDIFGNTFYRDYEFGAGDDTGVFWNDNNKFSKNQMLFLSTVINLFLVGKYDFGYKLRASQTSNFEISLPMGTDGNIDYNFMTNLMSAIQKHVIKDVVKYLDNRIEAINQIIKED